MAEMLLTWRRWHHRKHEAIEFLDETVARRRVTIELTIPDIPPIPASLPYVYVPLAPLRKRTLPSFDLMVDGQHPVSMLARAAHEPLLTFTLFAAGLAELGSIPGDFQAQGALYESCSSIVTLAPSEALSAIRVLERDNRFDRESDFLRLAHVLAGHLVVIVPLEYEAHRRHVVTFSYDERIGDPPLGLARTIKTGAAWQSKPVWFRTALSGASSYHLTVDAPASLHITRRALITSDHRVAMLIGPPRQARYYHVPSTSISEGYALIHLRPLTSTSIRGAACTGILGTLLLLALGIAALTGSLHPSGNLAAQALLLFLPGLLSVLLIRPAEHPMATHMMFSVRMLTLVPGAACLVGAVLIATVGKGTTAMGIALLALALACATAAGVLAVTWRRCRFLKGAPIAESLPAHMYTDK